MYSFYGHQTKLIRDPMNTGFRLWILPDTTILPESKDVPQQWVDKKVMI